MKKLFMVLAVVLAVVVVLAVLKDVIIKISVEKGVEIATGLPLKIQSFKVGIINTIVDIKGLLLQNPKGFKDSVMVDMPGIYVHYDLPAILGGTIHLQEAKLNLKEFIVIKNEKGELNLDSLKAVQAQKGKETPGEKSKRPNIKIDILELKIGKAVYKDYSRGGAPSVTEFNVNINEKFTNITDPNAVVSIIVVKALMNTTIAGLANFDLGGLKNTVSGTLASATKLTGEVAKQAQQVIGGATKATEGAVKGAQEGVQKATEGVKDVFNALPFGSQEK